MTLEFLEIMEEKIKNDSLKEYDESQGTKALSFMVEVLSKPKAEKLFIVRVPSPSGFTGVACCGSIKEFNQFISSL